MLRQQCRTLDAVGRIGGDEFLVILPMTSTEEAMIFVERVQQARRQAGAYPPGVRPSVAQSRHRRSAAPRDHPRQRSSARPTRRSTAPSAAAATPSNRRRSLSVSDAEFLLLGDALWLEFVNTAGAGWRRPRCTAAIREPTSAGPGRLRVEPPRGCAPRSRRRAPPRPSCSALARRLDAGRRPPPSAIEAINRQLRGMDGREQLIRVSGIWRLRFQAVRPPRALEAIARSAAQTLTDPVSGATLCHPGLRPLLPDETTRTSPATGAPGAPCGRAAPIERRRGTLVPRRWSRGVRPCR